MGKIKRFNEEEVGNGLQYIRTLPPKAGKTQAEVAAIYAPSIRGAMKRGYSLEEIQQGLAKTVGVSIQMTKLKAAVDALDGGDVSVSATAPEKETAKKPAKKTTDVHPNQTNENKKAEQATQKADEQINEATPETKVEATTPQPEQEQAEKAPDTPAQNGKEQTVVSNPEKMAEEATTPKAENQPPATANEDTPVLHKDRINLNCTKEERDHVKSLGAIWDNDKNVLYVPAGTDLRPFEKWLPKALNTYAQK